MNVVITGGTQGMGRAIAEVFAAEGANITLTARTESDLKKTQEILALKFPAIKILTIVADLGKMDQVKELGRKIRETWKSVDLLVNNAGVFLVGNMMEEPEENIQKMMSVNVMGPIRLTRALYPALKTAAAPHVINICSVASQKYFPGSGSYSVSKYALLGYTRALREEWKEENIKVTALLPGATWSRSWADSGIDPSRIMQANDVAQAVKSIWEMPATALVEELVLRPPLGDL